MRTLWFSAALAVASPAMAGPISSPAKVVDGETLILTDLIVRLHGIDAVEAHQTCKRGAESWACGQEAKRELAALVNGRIVECLPRSIDQYGRTVATCTVNGFDLTENLTRSGLAVALADFSNAYIDAEDRSKALRLGIWAGEFNCRATIVQPIQPPHQLCSVPWLCGRAGPSHRRWSQLTTGTAPMHERQAQRRYTAAGRDTDLRWTGMAMVSPASHTAAGNRSKWPAPRKT